MPHASEQSNPRRRGRFVPESVTEVVCTDRGRHALVQIAGFKVLRPDGETACVVWLNRHGWKEISPEPGMHRSLRCTYSGKGNTCRGNLPLKDETAVELADVLAILDQARGRTPEQIRTAPSMLDISYATDFLDCARKAQPRKSGSTRR